MVKPYACLDVAHKLHMCRQTSTQHGKSQSMVSGASHSACKIESVHIMWPKKSNQMTKQFNTATKSLYFVEITKQLLNSVLIKTLVQSSVQLNLQISFLIFCDLLKVFLHCCCSFPSSSHTLTNFMSLLFL